MSESGIVPLLVLHEGLSEPAASVRGGCKEQSYAWHVLMASSLLLQNGQAAPEEGGNIPSKVKALWGCVFKSSL